MHLLRTVGALSSGPAALLAGTAGLGWGSRGPLAAVTAPGSATLDDLLALSAAVAAWCVLGWLTVGLLLAVLAGMRGPASPLARLAAMVTPLALRRIAAVLLGASLAGAPVALALPAHAGMTRALVATAQPATPAQALAGAAGLDHWTPDRPTAPAAAHPVRERPATLFVSAPRPERAATQEVVVRRGDTLWDITARALGPGATAADIAAGWPRWHAANRSTIGADPDLIRPGQVLRPPRP